MQQYPPHANQPPSGAQFPQPGGAVPPAPAGGPPAADAKRKKIALACLLVFLVLVIVNIRSLKKETAACDSATNAAIAATTPEAALAAAKTATGICNGKHGDALAAVVASATASLARPALLAAGYAPEQLDKAATTATCKAKGFFAVEMIEYTIPGNPHYFKCDDALYTTVSQTDEQCAANNQVPVVAHDEHDQIVRACRAKTAEELRGPEPTQQGDGSYQAVDEYLANLLKDPDSYKTQGCTRAVYTNSVWVTECRYRAKNSFGGFAQERRRFYIDGNGGIAHEGNVVKAEKLAP